MSWDIFAQYAMWNYTMKTVITLPVMDVTGEMFVTDGDELCGFHDDHTPVGPCIQQYPITGPVFDLTVVTESFLYMLYKCGFMVAYSIAGEVYHSFADLLSSHRAPNSDSILLCYCMGLCVCSSTN